MQATDERIARDLIAQVAACVRPYRTEEDVTTVITRPMWNAFLRFSGVPENTPPTEWKGKGTVRVYGSKTVVVESGDMAAVSFYHGG